MKIQNVDRGSIWVKQEDRYVCGESLGSPTDTDIIKGASISTDRPSIVGWVIENAEMTVAEAGEDPRHYKEFEKGMKLKSAWIIAFPLILKDGQVYGVVQLIDTNKDNKRLNVDKKYLRLLKSIVDMGSIALSNALSYTEQLESECPGLPLEVRPTGISTTELAVKVIKKSKFQSLAFDRMN